MTWEEIEDARRKRKEAEEQALADEWGTPEESDIFVVSFPHLDNLETKYK